MVLEHLLPEGLLERREWSAFFLALIYATVSIIIARWLFPANSGIVSVIFVSIFLLPYFDDILKRDEIKERRESKLGFRRLLRDNGDAIKIYFFLFFGIYLAYMIYAFIAPLFNYDTGTIFREQINLAGGATFSTTTFFSILFNNWWVLLACFLIALVAGDGAVFFVAWNASTWGAIFGYRAIEAWIHTGMNPVVALLTIVVITLPHALLEGGAYILAAIAGGIISDEIVEKSDEVRKFVMYFVCAILLFAVLRILFRQMIVGNIAVASASLPAQILLFLLTVISALLLLYLMHYIFDNRGDGAIFRYNFYLFLLAVAIFTLGALIETFVLYNAVPLQHVYLAAIMG